MLKLLDSSTHSPHTSAQLSSSTNSFFLPPPCHTKSPASSAAAEQSMSPERSGSGQET